MKTIKNKMSSIKPLLEILEVDYAVNDSLTDYVIMNYWEGNKEIGRVWAADNEIYYSSYTNYGQPVQAMIHVLHLLESE